MADFRYTGEKVAPNAHLLADDVTTGNKVDPDGVDHPQHYNVHPSGVECIEVVRHMNFNLGNVVKYLWRAGIKDTEVPLQDLKKAAWYLQDEISRRENNVR
jgi:hypothetical protein